MTKIGNFRKDNADEPKNEEEPKNTDDLKRRQIKI